MKTSTTSVLLILTIVLATFATPSQSAGLVDAEKAALNLIGQLLGLLGLGDNGCSSPLVTCNDAGTNVIGLQLKPSLLNLNIVPADLSAFTKLLDLLIEDGVPVNANFWNFASNPNISSITCAGKCFSSLPLSNLGLAFPSTLNTLNIGALNVALPSTIFQNALKTLNIGSIISGGVLPEITAVNNLLNSLTVPCTNGLLPLSWGGNLTALVDLTINVATNPLTFNNFHLFDTIADTLNLVLNFANGVTTSVIPPTLLTTPFASLSISGNGLKLSAAGILDLSANPNLNFLKLDGCTTLLGQLTLPGLAVHADANVALELAGLVNANVLAKLDLNVLDSLSLDFINGVVSSVIPSNLLSNTLNSLSILGDGLKLGSNGVLDLTNCKNLQAITLNAATTLFAQLTLPGIAVHANVNISLSLLGLVNLNVVAKIDVNAFNDLSLGFAQGATVGLLPSTVLNSSLLSSLSILGDGVKVDANGLLDLSGLPNLQSLSLVGCNSLLSTLKLPGIKLPLNISLLDLDLGNLVDLSILSKLNLNLLNSLNLGFLDGVIPSVIPPNLLSAPLSVLSIVGDGLKLDVSAAGILDLSANLNLTSLSLTGCTTLLKGLALPGIKVAANVDVALALGGLLDASVLAKINLNVLGALDLDFDANAVVSVVPANLLTANLASISITGDGLKLDVNAAGILDLSANVKLDTLNLLGCNSLLSGLQLPGIKVNANANVDLSLGGLLDVSAITKIHLDAFKALNLDFDLGAVVSVIPSNLLGSTLASISINGDGLKLDVNAAGILDLSANINLNFLALNGCSSLLGQLQLPGLKLNANVNGKVAVVLAGLLDANVVAKINLNLLDAISLDFNAGAIVSVIPSNLLTSTVGALTITGDGLKLDISAAGLLDLSANANLNALSLLGCTSLFANITVGPGIKVHANADVALTIRGITAGALANINLNAFASLDLGDNLLDIDIKTLGLLDLSLSKLNLCNLSNNLLTGVVPSSLCQIGANAVIDLSNNQLSGQLASCFLCELATFRAAFLGNNFTNFNINTSLSLGCPTLKVNTVVAVSTVGGLVKVSGVDLGWVIAAITSGLDVEVITPNLEFGFKVPSGSGTGFNASFNFHTDIPLSVTWGYLPPAISNVKIGLSAGASLTITGTNFGNVATNVKVTIDGVLQTISSCDHNVIVLSGNTVTVAGDHTVAVDVSGQVISTTANIQAPTASSTTDSTTANPSSASLVSINVIAILLLSVLVSMLAL
ncbi:hypothetical protein SAMD00019534_072770 [Acytostelium subglobosum LB1]|uniref:hypothetical protein n=1 Tax=Acytostelium subglobosum LB1 TaxID=1410327 RepID=UPI000644FC83|nr:hypothetical protein SAMD00019534_072770 [Acytostelium subglobosum LB1]GAM24102.1 hypothetical protein SAMD00019534_072770 [Acytostelium subglobosum LB1]|eukprot:XP_012753138.1 hypothetical protein SAMD00019534_072770 [Acytostelium subglobosum LB1]